MMLRKCEQYITASLPREYFAVFVVLLTLVAIVFFPALRGELLVESFADRLHYPVFQFFSGEMRARGAVPLWVEYLGGFPVGLSQFGFFYPLNALYRFFDATTLYNWLVLFHLVAAGFFTYIFTRSALTLSRYGALVAALVFLFHQLGIQHLTLNIYANFYPLLPLFLLIVFHLRAAGRRRSVLLFLLMSCIAAVGWLAASAEHMFYIMLIVVGYAAFLDARQYRKDRRARKNFHTLLLALFAVALGALLVLPWFVTVRQIVELGVRGGGYALTGREELFNYLGITDAFKLFFPYFNVPEAFVAHVPGLASPVALYFGVLPLFLVLVGILFMRGRRELYFFGGIALGIFLLQIRATHLYDLLHRLPILNLFRGAWKPLFFANFSLALFAGYGVDALGDLQESASMQRLLRVLKYMVAVLTVGALSVAIVLQFGEQLIAKVAQSVFYRFFYVGTAQLPSGFYNMRLAETVAQIRHTFELGNPRVLWGVFLLLASLVLLSLYCRKRFSFLLVKRIALALIIADIVIVYRGFYSTAPQSALDENPVAEFLVAEQAALMPFRTDRILFDFYYPAVDSDPENIRLDRFGERRFQFDLATLKPNTPLYYNIESVSGEDNLESRRTALFRQSLDALASLEEDSLESMFSDEPFAIFLSSPLVRDRVSSYQTQKARRLLGMQNVRYLISPLPLAGWKKVFQTATVLNIPVYVLENTEWMDRVYFAKSAVFVSDNDDTAIRRVFSTDDFREETVISCRDPRCAYLRYAGASNSDKLQVDELRPGFARLYTDTTEPKWLVYSESKLPTWEARIDGRLIDIHAANYLYQAVYVPAGKHEIEFKYPGIMKQFRYALRNLLGQ